MEKVVTATVLGCSLLLATVAQAQQSDTQPGTAERLGERIDRGLDRLTEEFREGWTELRQSINQFGVEARVYSRLRWDKAIDVDTIDIEVTEADIVLLRGTVPDEVTKRKAVQLAEQTVGVSQVTDDLKVKTPEVTQQSPTIR